MENREEWLADTLVMLADTLVADFDVIDFLATLTERIVELLAASEVGLMLAEPQGHLRVMAATTERMRMIDLFELQADEGPCLECFHSGESILNVDLEPDATDRRWPTFGPRARDAGFRTVHALPMRLRDEVIGAANIFHAVPTTISVHDAHLAQALVDAATIGVLQERAVQQGEVLAEQLQHALNSRVAIEQAKGAVAERADVDMTTAFAWMRGYARSHNLRLATVARSVLERSLAVDELRGTSASDAEA
jgi:GAF domain-containing protein